MSMTSKELISNSVDSRCYRYNIKILLIVFALCDVFVSLLIMYLFWFKVGELVKALIWCNSLFAIAYLPMTIFYSIKLSLLVRRCNTYIFTETWLKNYNVGPMGHISFSVDIIDADGNLKRYSTESIYSTKGSIARFDAWYNKRVKIAYTPKSETVIICCVL